MMDATAQTYLTGSIGVAVWLVALGRAAIIKAEGKD